ncbi:MAG: EAL domain-containing response regulator [Rhizobiaceae bacterium]
MAGSVLVVDDSQDIVELVRRSIGRLEGWTVEGALNGKDGLLAITAVEKAFDVIVLDLSLPDIDGLEFLRRLSERDYCGGIILASGHSNSVLAAAKRLAELQRFQVLDVLQKPFSPAALRRIISSFSPAGRGTVSNSNQRADDLAGAKLIPYYQPQFDTNNGQVVGFEALVRVKLSDGPLVGPSALFSQVRTASDRVRVALSIAELVLKDLNYANSSVESFPGVSLNFDARVLEDNEAMSQFTALVDRAGVDRSQITIEVIEKSLPNSDVSLLESLTRLSMSGFGISLDDYGIGGSNHDLLRRCPFDELKLDHTLIQSGSNDPLSRKFISTAVDTARAMNLRLIAEGIETVKDLAFVKEAGIHIVQGFLFERPMPIERALPFAMARHAEELIA